jgi:dTDP-4-dehydrorhamnose reductase
VINAAGYGQVRSGQRDPARCRRDNAVGPSVLAAACARHGAALLTFSTDLVFDGAKAGPYLESDTPSPQHDCGRHKAEAERSVLLIHPEALVVRTSALFGPWDGGHFLARLHQAVAHGTPLAAAQELVTPTYLPDLLHACLDLLIDRERGLWHLSHGNAVSWLELGQRYCQLAGYPPGLLRPGQGLGIRRALGSTRGALLPSLEHALRRYLGTAAVC